jgi:hypothetical protein
VRQVKAIFSASKIALTVLHKNSFFLFPKIRFFSAPRENLFLSFRKIDISVRHEKAIFFGIRKIAFSER